MHYFNISALSKRDACFTLGGFFKGDVQSPGVSLLRCELECCSGSYCNNQVPRLLPDSVTVFTPTGKKRKTNKQTNNHKISTLAASQWLATWLGPLLTLCGCYDLFSFHN